MTTVAPPPVAVTETAPVLCIATCVSVLLATLVSTALSGTTVPAILAHQIARPVASICPNWTALSVSAATAGGETSVIKTSTSVSLRA